MKGEPVRTYNDVNWCKETKKYCYSSEAKAVRAMQRYDDIKRVYHCHSCYNWHTTSLGVGLSLELGIIDNKKKKKKKITQKDIEKRLKQLKENE